MLIPSRIGFFTELLLCTNDIRETRISYVICDRKSYMPPPNAKPEVLKFTLRGYNTVRWISLDGSRNVRGVFVVGVALRRDVH